MKKYLSLLFISIILISCGGLAENISIGEEAPNFTLKGSDGNSYSLTDYTGISPVVVYFYPKANTPGCTKQACGIRDDYTKFTDNGIIILGISTDSIEDINEFEMDYNLNFPLLSDESKEISKKYGVLNNLGFANRITFIIDKKGNLAHIIKNVNVDSHSNDVFELAKTLL